jgi:hypothetical protein
VNPLQSFEAASWNFRSSRDELDHLSQTLLIVGFKDLPEPFNNVVFSGVATKVFSVVPQVVD